MNARVLVALFDSVYLVALSTWVGSILIVRFAVAPALSGDEAGERLARRLFPTYYLWGTVAGASALPCLVASTLCVPSLRGPAVGAQAAALLAGVLIMLHAGHSAATGHARRAARLDLAALAIGLALLIAFAARRAPAGAGPGVSSSTSGRR